MKRYTVYAHVSPVGKFYVGRTSDYVRRSKVHAAGVSRCTAFQKAISEFGWVAFTHIILAIDLDEDAANAAEIEWIERLTARFPNGYNLDSGGGPAASPVAITRERMSIASKSWLRKPGRTLSEEHRRKIAAAHMGKPGTMTGRKHSAETRAKMSAAQTGNTKALGNRHTDESRARMREAQAVRRATERGIVSK